MQIIMINLTNIVPFSTVGYNGDVDRSCMETNAELKVMTLQCFYYS